VEVFSLIPDTISSKKRALLRRDLDTHRRNRYHNKHQFFPSVTPKLQLRKQAAKKQPIGIKVVDSPGQGSSIAFYEC